MGGMHHNLDIRIDTDFRLIDIISLREANKYRRLVIGVSTFVLHTNRKGSSPLLPTK